MSISDDQQDPKQIEVLCKDAITVVQLGWALGFFFVFQLALLLSLSIGYQGGMQSERDLAMLEDRLEKESSKEKRQTLLINSGVFFTRKGNHVLARTLYRRAWEFAVESAFSNFALANSYARTGDYKKAETFYHQAIDLGLHGYAVFFNLGLVYGVSNDFTQAIHFFKKAVASDSNRTEGLYNLAIAYLNSGDQVRGQLFLRNVMVLDPGFASVIDYSLRQKEPMNDTGVPIEGMYRIRQILVGSNDLAEDIFDRLKKGQNFLHLIEKYSIDPNKYRGGDSGPFLLNEVNPEIAEAVKSLQVGGVSSIIASSHGYHIIMRIQ